MENSPLKSLRIGVLCNDLALQRWQLEALEQVLAIPQAELVLLVRRAEAEGRDHKAGAFARARNRSYGTALYRYYRRKHFRPRAMDTVDASALLKEVPVLDCEPEMHGIVEHFEAADLAAIAEYKPDVLIRFGFNILGGGILDLPTHGVWSFHHGDPEAFRGGPPGLWEIMHDKPVTGAVLQRLTSKLDGGRILRQGWFKTIDHSLEETVDTVLSHSAGWPAQVMKQVLAGDHSATQGEAPASLGKLYRYPGNFTFLSFLWKLFSNKLRFHRHDLDKHEEWNVGVLHQPIAALLDEHPSLNIRWLPAPGAGSFRADPFGYIGDDGRVNLLYERFDHRSALGDISRIRPKKDNVLKRSRCMLNTGMHLSYPYVVQLKDEVYVIPESASAGKVALYRVSEANDELRPVRTLLEEPLFDPTLFQHEGRWWMMGTKAPLSNVALYAYYADDLEGPYQPHLLNPIKHDIASARPGGTPFVHEGQLWRPAQDSSETYGGRIALNRVLELTPERFREETVKHIGPFSGSAWNQGMHTLSALGDLTFVDGKRFVSVPERKREAKQRKLRQLKRKREE